jgi:hypothetical protein
LDDDDGNSESERSVEGTQRENGKDSNVVADGENGNLVDDDSNSDGKLCAAARVTMASKSKRQPLKGRAANRNARTTAMPGTLLFTLEEAKGDVALDGNATAEHIYKWMAILGNGGPELEWALNKERHHLNRNPIMFAFLEPDSHIVQQLAHGFEYMALDNNGNNANKKVGFFIGDQVKILLDKIATQHDPPFWTVNNFTTLAAQFHGKAATAVVGTKVTETLIPGDAKARMIDVSKLFPVPMLWWSFFWGDRQMVTETHRWLTGVTHAWTSETKKAAANIACQWIWATCMHSTTLGSSSGVLIAIRP